jgi:hypothetical protein
VNFAAAGEALLAARWKIQLVKNLPHRRALENRAHEKPAALSRGLQTPHPAL